MSLLDGRDGNSFVQRRYVFSYFVLTYVVSWGGAFLLVAKKLIHGEAIPKLDGILMFPIMLIGPSFAGIFLSRIVDGKAGLRDLLARMRRIRFSVKWYLMLLVPPALVVVVLFALKGLVSPVFTPNFFVMGVLFGVPAGIFEEIGWMGYAFPKMCRIFSPITASMLLGLLWGLWHVPVIDYLGTATPHGNFWLPYFLAFTAAMTAIRVLIGWIYINTKSVVLAQLMHVSSTGSLVVLSPPRVNAAQETLWYVVYAILLWMAVVIVAAGSGFGNGIDERA